MALIVLENPTGTVDGSNTVFTTSADIYQVVEVNVDGITYLGSIDVTGTNEITLGDAPQSYVYVTYYDSAPVTPTYTGPAISLLEAYNALKNQLKDISDVPQATFVQWCEYINDFTYRYILGVDPDRFLKTTSLSIVAGTSTYSVPTDFRDMQTWNTGFFITDNNGFTTSARIPVSGPGQSYVGYYISRNNFIFTPTPQQSQTLTWIYTVKNSRLTSIDQYFTVDGTAYGLPILEREYLLYVMRALSAAYFSWDEDPGSEGLADQRFIRALDELCENIRRQPQSVGLVDFSQIYQTGGWWGSYYSGWNTGTW